MNIYSPYRSSVLPSSAGRSVSHEWQQIYRDPSHHETHTVPMRSVMSSHITHLLVQFHCLVEYNSVTDTPLTINFIAKHYTQTGGHLYCLYGGYHLC